MISTLAGRELLELLACVHITTLPFFGIFCSSVFILLFFTPFWYISLLYAVWWYYDRDTPFRGGRPLPFLRDCFIWRYAARYFPTHLHKTTDLDPSKNYMFVFHPHSMAAFCGFLNFGTNANNFDKKFPGINVHILSVNLQLIGAFYRDYIMALGVQSANADSIIFALTQMGPGHSVWLAVGGRAEAFLGDHNAYTLKLKTRKGFIRIALKTKATIVPVFSFNEHRYYHIPPLEKGTFPYYFDRLMSLFTDHMLPIDVHGRWWWCGPLVPKRVPVDTVVGAPIDFTEFTSSLPKDEDPPQELVDKCHQIYMEALCKLYDDHKARFGDENTPLIFV